MVKLILLFVIFLNFISSVLVVGRDGNSRNDRLFCVVSFLASLWTFANYMAGVRSTPAWLEASYASAALVLAAGLVWVLHIARHKVRKGIVSLIAIAAAILAVAAFIPGFIAVQYSAIYLGGVFVGTPSLGFYLYIGIFCATACLMLWQIHIARAREPDKKRRLQLAYVFSGVLALLVLSFLTDFVLPSLSVFKLSALPSIGFLLFLICAGYSLLLHDAFNAEVIAAELTIFSLWAFTLVQVFALDTFGDQIMSLILLSISIAVGVQLRRSVAAETRQRKKLEAITNELRAANLEIAEANKALSELSALKTEFLSFATHQLRNPLAAISGYAEMLGEGSAGKLSEKQKDVVSSMSEAAKHLSSTVEDFLNVSKIERGGLEYFMEEFDLGAMIASAASDMEMLAREKGLAMSFEMHGSKPIMIFGDEGKLRQVAENLMDNAIKYTRQGNIRLRLYKKDPDQICFEVADTGIGIARDAIGGIFEKFRRGTDGKMAANGSGIGLYLAREIVEAHKGRIEAHSDGKGRGAVFYVILSSGVQTVVLPRFSEGHE